MKYRMTLLAMGTIVLGSCAIYPGSTGQFNQPQQQPIQILIQNEHLERDEVRDAPVNVKEEFAKAFPPVAPTVAPVRKPDVTYIGCKTMFQPPAPTTPPKFDVGELKKVDRNDNAKIQGILLDHIEKLHEYVREQQRKNKEAYDKYRRLCG